MSIRKCSRRPTTGGSRQAVPEIESDKRSISHFGPSLTFQQTLPSGREQLKRMIKPANLFTSNVYNLLEVLGCCCDSCEPLIDTYIWVSMLIGLPSRGQTIHHRVGFQLKTLVSLNTMSTESRIYVSYLSIRYSLAQNILYC